MILTLNFNPFPRLNTKRLLLRPITDEDAGALFALRSDETVMRFIDRPRAGSQSDALQLIRKINEDLASNTGITWGISLKEDQSNTLIGTIGFWRIDKANFRAEIGYLLDPRFFRRGLMDEAIREVLSYGFSEMKLHSVEANVNDGNMASAQLLQKNGFVKEAHFRENYYYNGKFLDSVIYSRLAGPTPGSH